MWGTRLLVFRRGRAGLFAVLLLAATICGLIAAQYRGAALFAQDGIPQAAAAVPELPIAPVLSIPEAAPDLPAATPPADAAPPVDPPAELPSSPLHLDDNPEDRKLIALTFDDGPDGNYTPRVLDILQEYSVHATFFLVGTQVDKYPDTVRRILDEGHSIGNHSWSHKDLTKLTRQEVSEQLDRTQQAIADATGYAPVLMRAPYGAISDALLDTLHERGMSHVYWTIDTRDWAGTSVAEMQDNVLKHAQPGAIVLMHSFGGRKHALEHTLELLPLIIEELTAQDFTFVTVEELMEADQASPKIVK